MGSFVGIVRSRKARAWAVADFLLVALVALAGVRLAMHVALPSDPPRRPPPMLQPGAVFSLPDSVLPRRTTTTVVLFALKDCFATEESVEFYKRLTQRIVAAPDLDLIVLTPDSSDAMRSWLNTKELGVENISQILDPSAVGLLLSPTLLVLNHAGLADTVLAGRLLPSEESAFLARLAGPEAQEPIGNVPDEIDDRELAELEREGSVQVLDAAERGSYLRSHRSGWVNIPLAEIPTRAKTELTTERRLVLECPPKIAPSCPAAGTFLRRSGFKRVSLLYTDFESR